jgi:hypothetical protein
MTFHFLLIGFPTIRVPHSDDRIGPFDNESHTIPISCAPGVSQYPIPVYLLADSI